MMEKQNSYSHILKYTGLFVAFLLGSLWGIVLLLRGYGRKAKLPFGPCLAIGGVVGVGFGNEICAFYEALF